MTDHSGQVRVEVADVVRPEFVTRVRRELTHGGAPQSSMVPPRTRSSLSRVPWVIGQVAKVSLGRSAHQRCAASLWTWPGAVRAMRTLPSSSVVTRRRLRRTSSVVITPPRSTWGNPLRVAAGSSVRGPAWHRRGPCGRDRSTTALMLRPWSRARDRVAREQVGRADPTVVRISRIISVMMQMRCRLTGGARLVHRPDVAAAAERVELVAAVASAASAHSRTPPAPYVGAGPGAGERDQPGAGLPRASAARTRSPRRGRRRRARARRDDLGGVDQRRGDDPRVLGPAGDRGVPPAGRAGPRRSPSRRRRAAGGDQLGAPVSADSRCMPRGRPDERGQPVAVHARPPRTARPRPAGPPCGTARRRAGGRRRASPRGRRRRARRTPRRSRCRRRARRTGPSRPSAQAGETRRGDSRVVHWRSRNASCRAAVASSTWRAPENGPR